MGKECERIIFNARAFFMPGHRHRYPIDIGRLSREITPGRETFTEERLSGDARSAVSAVKSRTFRDPGLERPGLGAQAGEHPWGPATTGGGPAVEKSIVRSYTFRRSVSQTRSRVPRLTASQRPNT